MRQLFLILFLLASPVWGAVAINDQGSGTTDPAVTPSAGSDRACYVTMFSDDAVNGEYAATALTYGGQSGTLISTVKPVSPFREGIAVAVFRLLESTITSMSGNAITPTWGDTDGTPDNPFYFVICFTGVDQGDPDGTILEASHDTAQATWDPGDVNGVADGYILGFSHLGSGATHVFDNLAETETVLNSGAHGVLGTVATTDTSAIDVAVTYGSAQRPGVFSGMVINPAAAGGIVPKLISEYRRRRQ